MPDLEDDDQQGGVAVAPDDLQPAPPKQQASEQAVSADELSPVQRPLSDVTNPVTVQQPLAPATTSFAATFPKKAALPQPGEAAVQATLPAQEQSQFVTRPATSPFLQPAAAPRRMNDVVSPPKTETILAGKDVKLKNPGATPTLYDVAGAEPTGLEASDTPGVVRGKNPNDTGDLPGSFEGHPENAGGLIFQAPREGAEEIGKLIQQEAASMDPSSIEGMPLMMPTSPGMPGMARLTPEQSAELYKKLIAPSGEAGSEFVGSQYEPQNLAMLGAFSQIPTTTLPGKALHGAIGGYFAGTMGADSVEQAYKSYLDANNGDVPQAVKEGVSALLSAGFAAEGTHGAAKMGAEMRQSSAHPEDLVSADELEPAPEVNQNAVQKSGPGEILQREPQPVGEVGSQRSGVEPSQQGSEVAQEGQEATPQRAQEANPDELQPVGKKPPSKSENAAIREVGKTRAAVVLDANTTVPDVPKSVGKVALPDGRTAIFSRSKASAADVLKLDSENALHRLTGEAPPTEAVELAKADIKGEEPESLAARGIDATVEANKQVNPLADKRTEEEQRVNAENDIHNAAEQMRVNLEEIAEHDPELAKRIEEEHPDVKAILAKSRELASNREAQNETGRDENSVRQAPTDNAGEVRENGQRPQVESSVPEKAAAPEVERRSLPRSETSQILLNKMHDELRASTDPQERAELEQHIKRESDLADADAILKAKGPTPTPAIDISPTRRNELKQQVSNLEAKSREYPSKLTSAERTDIYRKQYALKDEIGKIDAENYKNNLQLNDAMRDWKSGRAYIDNGGNYRLYGEKRGFDGRDGRIAPWNKAAKVAFADSNELGHAGTAIYPTQEEAQKQMREEKEARHRDTADVAHPNDPLHFGNQQRYREEGSWHYRNSDGSHWTRVTDPKTKARFDAEYKNDEGQYKDLSKTEQFDAAVERTGAKVEEGKPSSLFRSKIKDAHDANLSDETTAALRAEIKDTPKFQREYFTSALQPALDAWKQHLGEKDFEKWASSKGTDKYPTKPTGDKNRFGADETARTFPDGLRKDQIYIKVPDDGHFLVNNNPFAIEKALKGATEGFAKVKSRPFEESPGKEANPRSPKEFDNEKYIVGLERELEKLRDKGAYGSAAEVAYHKDQINAAEENLRQATSLSGKPPESEKAEARSKEAGFVKAEALNPVAMAQAGADVYHDFIDKALEKMEIGQPRPEIRKIDPQAADLALRMDAGGQYHKAVGEAIAKRVTDPMLEDFNKKDSPQVTAEKNKVTRDRMKGFHFLADAQNREWLKENKPEDFARWSADPKIQQAIENYKQPQEDLRQAVKELGGKTIDQDYIKRVMDFVTSGIAEFDEERGGKQFGMSSRDNVVGPQVDRSHQRTADAGFYWEHGVFDFGPSFEKRYSEVMHKLDENKLAVHVMSRGTRLESGDALPDSIIYNGERFYRPEIAKEIRDIQKKGSSADSKELAEELGVEELPLPKNVQEYSLYQPLKGARFERAAKGLASSAIEGADSKVLEAQGYNVNRMAGLKYAVPKDLADAMNDAERTTGQGRIARVVSNLLSPITQAIRQQIVGLAYGIPHMGNIIRKVMQATPGAQLNPLAWVNGVKVAFSKELKARGASGVNDNTYAMLLRNAGISEGAVPEYKHYIEGNFDVANWKNLLAEPNRNFVKNAFKEGGRARGDVTVKSSLAGLPRLAFEPLNRFSEAGHNNLFKAGGIDQRARLWMADMLQERFPKMKESDIAHAVNQQLGRYNRASWTDVQRGAAPYMLFPGWDYSSITYAVKHPLKTTVPAAVLMLIANRTFNALGMNEDKDKNDLTRLHIGQRSFKSNIVSDNMGNHVLGWALRGGQAALDHKNRRDIMGAAVKGIPGDVGGATVDTLNPVLSGIGEVAYGKTRSGGGRDIMPGGDLKKRGRILPNKGAEDLTDFAARKAFPIYDTVRGDQRPDAISSAGRLAGISTYSTKKKR